MVKTNKFIKYCAAALAFAAAPALLTSCSDDFSQPPATMPDGGVGSGLWNDPMTSYQVRIGSVNAGLDQVWACGYVVGAINTDLGNTLNARNAVWSGGIDGKYNTNLLISDYTPEQLEALFVASDGTDTRCDHVATVQLTYGPVREGLNLQSHPDNLGRLVCIKGSAGEKYCGAYGLRDTSDFNWGDTGKEELPPPPPMVIEAPYWENFDASTDINYYTQRGWANVETAGGLSGWYIKEFSGQNYITTSAYKGDPAKGPYENWLITPAIDIDKMTQKTLTFRTQAAYQADNSTLEVFVMTSDVPGKSTDVKLPAVIATPPASGYSPWAESGILDLSAFSGKIYIGWRYYSAHGGPGMSSTYCVDDVNIGNAPRPNELEIPQN